MSSSETKKEKCAKQSVYLQSADNQIKKRLNTSGRDRRARVRNNVYTPFLGCSISNYHYFEENAGSSLKILWKKRPLFFLLFSSPRKKWYQDSSLIQSKWFDHLLYFIFSIFGIYTYLFWCCHKQVNGVVINKCVNVNNNLFDNHVEELLARRVVKLQSSLEYHDSWLFGSGKTYKNNESGQ